MPELADKVAIIAMAGRFPGAENPEQLWRDSLAGVVRLSRFEPEDLIAQGVPDHVLCAPGYVPVKGVLSGPDRFDPEAFALPPAEAALIDPQQRIFLEICAQALDIAGARGARAGVFAGQFISTYLLQLIEEFEGSSDPVRRMQAFQGNTVDQLASRVAYRLGLTGPAVSIQTACSTALAAVHTACLSIAAGDCDMALAGGVCVSLPFHSGYQAFEGGIFSPTGRCRPFSSEADGTVFSDGAGVFLLKRLDLALDDGDPIIAVVSGSALNNDGARKAGHSAPSFEGQVEVLSDALQVAGLPARAIGFLETHGAGTPLGDEIEFEALAQVYGRDRRAPLYLGAAKASIGHTEAAAGAAGLIRAVCAVRDGRIPPIAGLTKDSARFADRNDAIRFPTETLIWPEHSELKRAAVSAFGVGGTNAHVIVEEAPQARPAQEQGGVRIFTLGSHDPKCLRQDCQSLADHLQANNLAASARALRARSTPSAWRRAFAADSVQAAQAALGAPSLVRAFEHPRVVFLFSGHGNDDSRGLADRVKADTALRDRFYALLEPVRDNVEPSSLLARAGALTFAEDHVLQWAGRLAFARLAVLAGIEPHVILGHSLGEFAAASLSGAWADADCARLVLKRGQLIDTLPDGAMTTVIAEQAVWRRIIEEFDGELTVAAFNGPGRVVLSGPVALLEQAEARLAELEALSQRLSVRRAFHNPAVDPIVSAWRDALSSLDFKPVKPAFRSTVSGASQYAPGPEHWVRHLTSTIDFVGAADKLAREGGGQFLLIEFGPSQGLAKAFQSVVTPLGADCRIATVHGESLEALSAWVWENGGPQPTTTSPAGPRAALPPRHFNRRPLRRTESHPLKLNGATKRVVFKTEPAGRPRVEAQRRRWLVIANTQDECAPVATYLKQAGQVMSISVQACADVEDGGDLFLRLDDRAENWADLMRSLRARVRTPTHVLDLRGCDTDLADRVDAVGRLAMGLDKERGAGDPIRLAVLTPQAMPVGPRDVCRAEAAGLAAAVAVIGVETQGVDLFAIDALASDAAGLVEAALIGSLQPRAVRQGAILVRGYANTQDHAGGFERNGVYLITGGSGDLGRLLTKQALDAGADRVFWIVRRAPEPPLSDARVSICLADVGDETAVASAVESIINDIGALNGVIHAAGIAEPCFIRAFDANAFNRAWRVKVNGLNNLIASLRRQGALETLGFVTAVSSTAALIPFAGQLGYATANASLAGAASQACAGEAIWTAIHLDTVSGIGMAAKDAGSAQLLGDLRDRISLRPEAAVRAIVQALNAGGEVVISRLDAQGLEAAPQLATDRARTAHAALKAERPSQQSLSEPPQDEAEERVAEIYCKVLGLQQIGRNDEATRFGADSLALARLRQQLCEAFDVAINLTELYGAQTVRSTSVLVTAKILSEIDAERGES